MAKWHFSEQRPDDVDDEDTVAKNFARESRRLTGVFVREFFQNVLDAPRTSGTGVPEKPHVRISIRDPAAGLGPRALPDLLSGVHPHLTAAGHDARRWSDEEVNALILEEFGTSGLIGTTTDSRAKGSDERWASFWFGEGKRTKKGASLGRAGQGKITYHLISGTRTVFALTRPQDRSEELLFGKCIVHQTHEVKGTHYKRHGYWPCTGENNQPLPTRNPEALEKIRNDFGLSREEESGTSWIIPYVDSEAFAKDRLIGEFVRDFFFSVLAGAVTAEIMGTAINESTLADVLKEHPLQDLPEAFVDFLEEAITLPDDSATFIHSNEDWYGGSVETPMSESAFEDETLTKARETLKNSELVAVKVPVVIEPLEGGRVIETISVFLKRLDNIERTHEVYVRNGLVIGEEQHLRNAPGRYFGMVRASDPHISEFLGFAEEASHMKWNTRETEVTERYRNVPRTVSSVRHSLPKLAKLLIGHTSGRQDDALIDFLSVPATGKKGPKSKTVRKRKKDGGGSDDGGGSQTKTPSRFEVRQATGTWKLTPGAGAATLNYPVQVTVDLAYATMPGEGNPFKVYHRFEFDLSDIQAHPIALTNAIVVSRDLNRLELEMLSPDFSVTVEGFSEHALKSRIRD